MHHLIQVVLWELKDCLNNSSFIKETFGDEIQNHYSNFGKKSVIANKIIVSDYERRILLGGFLNVKN